MKINDCDPTIRALYDNLLSRHLQTVEQGERHHFMTLLKGAASPIEARMLAALLFMDCPLYFSRAYDPRVTPLLPAHKMSDDSVWLSQHEEVVTLMPQAQVGAYRVDFLIYGRFEGRDQICKVIVECDGHDFHERTKEQAKRDRQMDRELTAAGYRVFRFTGSEIYRDAVKCADEVERFLKFEEERTRP